MFLEWPRLNSCDKFVEVVKRLLFIHPIGCFAHLCQVHAMLFEYLHTLIYSEHLHSKVGYVFVDWEFAPSWLYAFHPCYLTQHGHHGRLMARGNWLRGTKDSNDEVFNSQFCASSLDRSNALI